MGQYFRVRTFRYAAAVAGQGEVHCGIPKSKSSSSSLMHNWWSGRKQVHIWVLGAYLAGLVYLELEQYYKFSQALKYGGMACVH